MLKLSQKKRKALLALAVAATVLGANNAFAASVHDKAISESNNYGASMRTYWKNAGVYDAKTHTYTFNEDITLKPKTSEQNLNFWTPLFGGIYVAGYNPVTIDMQGHRLDVAMNMDPVAEGAVFNPGAISPNVLHVTSSSLTINNVKGMELSAAGPGLATGNITGIYLAGTYQDGSYHDGKGLASLTINNADGWDNAIKFHSSQDQVENGIFVWKNSGSADLKISGLVDIYVGNGSSAITVRGGDYTGDTQGVPTAYIGGGAFKTSTGRAANVSGGLLSVNSKLENGEIVASDANRDVQIDGNISVGDVGRDQGTVTLGLNTADSYFKGIMYTNYGEGDAHMMLQNGAQWTNTSTSQGDNDYHGSSLKQFAGSEGAANTGYIFQNDNAALNLGNYSGYTTVFYEHNNDGTKTADYTAGNTIINTAKEGSNITLITDKVDVNNEATVNAALNALAGKLYYNAAKNGEKNVEGMAVIAEGLTASSKALKTSGIYFDEENGQGTTNRFVNQKITDFTTTLTGVKEDDSEYAEANVIVGEGTYKFKKDTTINTEGSAAIDLKQGTTINASKRLTLNVGSESGSTVYALGASTADGVTVNADKLVINASSTDGRIEGINVGQGAQSKDKPMKLTINGDTEMNIKGIGYTLGLYANGNSEVTFNGNVTAMGNENSEWGLTSEEGAFGYYGCSLVYSGSNYSLQMGPKVTINGDVNAKIDGNALFANGGHAKLTINGGGNIEINKDNEHNYYAMIAESGTTSMNVNLDENYNAVSARDNKLVLKGNVGASTGAINANEPELYTKVNLGLATADSEWTGIAYNGFNDEGNSAYGSDKKFYGAINVFLQNGATWNNEQWGEAVAQFEGSHVAKFVGGESEATAGNIFQKDSNNLTIDNYSGNTNIFYAHTGNGEAAENYAAGDTIIKAAAKDSVVSLITDNTGVAMDNKDSVANVLNALAGKLTYSNFTKDEKNLTGYVKIADGLTASSKALETGDISFSKEDGKGYYTNVPKPKTIFTTAITGDLEADTEYAGNIADGKYFFDGDSTITVGAATAADIKKALTIDAADHKLSIIATSGNWSEEKTFKHNAEGTTKITAGELVIGQPDGGFYDRTGMSVENGTVDITAAKTTVYAQNDFYTVTYGVHASNNNSRVDIHGDLDLKFNFAAPVHGLVADKGAAINVDGKASIDMSGRDGNAVAAINSGSVVNVGGGTIKAWNGQRNTSYGLLADSGIVNVNMNDDKTAAGTVTTVISGNARANGEDGMINVGLSDKESSLTGVAFSQNNGVINMYLNNGAAWNNQVWGKTDGGFDGSHVTKFAGGASEAAAGNILQKDSNNLTIDNYSGNTNIFYAHTGNGENASNYAAGDTIIKSAAAGSVVSMITDNSGIAMENDASVANVLNALAGKLTYSNFASGENNLNGSVKIAAGLTASDKIMKVDTIKFNKDTGKGYTKEETVNPGGGEKTTFTDAITGEKQGVFSAVQQEDLSYVFTEDASVTVNQMTHKEADPDWAGSFIISGAAVQNAAGVENLVIKAEDKTLKLKVALDDKTVPPDKNPGILDNRIPLRGIDNSIAGSTTSVTAGTLDINIDNTYSRKTSSGNPIIGECGAIGIYAKSAGEKAVVEVTGNTAIKAHGYNNVYGVNANGNAEIKLHGDLTMAKDGEDWAIDNVIKGQNTTTLVESSWRIIAGINANGAGANVTVDGKTTIAAHGSGVVAADGATVNLGAADIEIKNNSSEYGYGFHALGAALGTVNVGGEGKTVTVKGNAGLFGKQGQKFVSDSKESVINLKLTDAESAWTGVAYKQFTDAEKEAGLSGSMNLTVANGASWNNEKYGYVYGDSEWEEYKFTGSEIADFVGGASEAKAGNIFQKDTNSLTIDNYSGNTNIFYAHTGNGEAAENYAAGDTIIKHAEKDSVVSLITDNTGIAMDSEDSVANVLNTLAGKLTYSNFVNGEKNLTGLVKIADGLTASSTALKTGNIAFSTEDGKGSLNKEDVKPEPPTPPTPTYPEDQKADKFDQGISGNDEKYKEEGVLKEDGSYVFTKNPTAIEVKDGAAVGATDKDIVIDTTKAKLVLKGETGIKADGAEVNVKGSTDISGKVGIDAVNGNVTINGSTVINGTDAAINAGEGANVDINTNNSALNIKGDINANGGNITVDSGKATGTIESNVTASNGGNVEISLNDKNSTLTGAYNVDADSSIVMNIANGATWNLTDDEDEASGMSLMRMAKAPAATAKGLTLNGGKTEAETGFINLQKRTKDVKIANYSGWETFIYSHEGAGDKVSDYKSGDTIIDKAAKGSGVILSTDGSGITMTDKKAVEATLKALAQKVTYKDHAANGENLSGKVQIAEGLTSSSVSKNLGTIHWDENGKGQYDLDSVNWSQIIEGDYETFVMKGVRSAATTSLHTWRDNMQDTYTGADMADEDGMFAKALGGKTSSDVKGLKDSNTYYGVQVGYDKAAANGWHTGVAFDYRNGDSNYLLGGKGDNQMYSLGVYGVKNFENDAFFRVAAKVGRVQNEYDVYNEIRSLKLHGDYKANAYGLTMEYGKTFGDEEAYFTPKAQLTWSQVGAKDYTAHTDNATMQISQDSYSSFVGRLGFEAGVKSEKGRVYAGLFAAHEFNGDISASYFANDGDRKHTSFNGEETWMEMKLGGTYDFSNNAHLYADFAKDFNGNFERKWKMNAGIRFEF